MNWAIFHAESERLAIDAFQKLREENIAEARVLYRHVTSGCKLIQCAD